MFFLFIFAASKKEKLIIRIDLTENVITLNAMLAYGL